MKNLVIVSFPAKTESLDLLKQSMKDALPDTRAYPGCISVDTYISTEMHPLNALVSGNACFKVSFSSFIMVSFAGNETITKFFINFCYLIKFVTSLINLSNDG